jgi:MFS-type transporter involved in bile tolerance (Atg22 family)
VIARALAKVGLVTPEQRAWAWYDCANSAYFTTVVTAVSPAFYATYAADGLEPAQATARFGAITTVSVAVIASAHQSSARLPTSPASRRSCWPSS